ncbi:MAG: BrnT family toxin [Planctomycetota bacterium JB042]
MDVTWDETKSASNQAKHGVSFEEASELFTSGVDYLEIYDEAHSADEDRFIAVGPIRRGVVLVVWSERFWMNDQESAIRIISARWATRRERDHYLSSME